MLYFYVTGSTVRLFIPGQHKRGDTLRDDVGKALTSPGDRTFSASQKLMGPPSYTWSAVGQIVIMWHMTPELISDFSQVEGYKKLIVLLYSNSEN